MCRRLVTFVSAEWLPRLRRRRPGPLTFSGAGRPCSRAVHRLGVIDQRGTAATGESVDCSGVTLGSLNCVQAIVLHAGFLDRLNHREVGLPATLRAAKGLTTKAHWLPPASQN